jgi:hypothetical protein
VTDEQPAADELAVFASIRRSLDRAVRRLEEAGIADEALAVFTTPKRVLFVQRAPVMLPVGRVWPLGVLLLGRDGSLHATGKITRAVPAGYPGYQSPGVEVRRGYRAAAHAGRFVEGDTVNFDTTEIVLEPGVVDVTSTPLFIEGGQARVRWNPTHPSQSRSLDVYLGDRVGLLIDPPGER